MDGTSGREGSTSHPEIPAKAGAAMFVLPNIAAPWTGEASRPRAWAAAARRSGRDVGVGACRDTPSNDLSDHTRGRHAPTL